MKAQDTIYVTEKRFYCDGGDGALGHPRVFLTVEKEGKIDCPYCGKHFVLEETSQPDTH